MSDKKKNEDTKKKSEIVNQKIDDEQLDNITGGKAGPFCDAAEKIFD